MPDLQRRPSGNEGRKNAVNAMGQALRSSVAVLCCVLLPRILNAQEDSVLARGGRGVLVAVLKSAQLVGEAPNAQYPDALRIARPEGEVVIRFVVRETGTVDRDSIHVVSATNQLFAEAARAALFRRRYTPALQAGRPVRQWLQARFVFHPPNLLNPIYPTIDFTTNQTFAGRSASRRMYHLYHALP